MLSQGAPDPTGINSVQFTGNLGRDPELRPISGPRPTNVAKFSLAVSQGKREQKKPPLWLYVEAWGDLAESAANRLRKGDRVSLGFRV